LLVWSIALYLIKQQERFLSSCGKKMPATKKESLQELKSKIEVLQEQFFDWVNKENGATKPSREKWAQYVQLMRGLQGKSLDAPPEAFRLANWKGSEQYEEDFAPLRKEMVKRARHKVVTEAQAKRYWVPDHET
jgi:hypothetical protein